METILIIFMTWIIFSNIYLMLKIDDISIKQSCIEKDSEVHTKTIELLIERNLLLANSLEDIRKICTLHNQIILRAKYGNK